MIARAMKLVMCGGVDHVKIMCILANERKELFPTVIGVFQVVVTQKIFLYIITVFTVLKIWPHKKKNENLTAHQRIF